MAIVKAIHSSPLDLEQPHVTVGSYTHSPLCKCVFQSSTVDFMSTCDIKQEMQRESDEYRHGDTLMCFMCYSKYLLFLSFHFSTHPCLPPSYSILHVISVLTVNHLPPLLFTHPLLLSYHRFSLPLLPLSNSLHPSSSLSCSLAGLIPAASIRGFMTSLSNSLEYET